MAIKDIFKEELNVINTGIESFKNNIIEAGGNAIHVDWKPPVDIDSELLEIINKNEDLINKANKEA